MKISVCIITKNEKDKLARCIKELKRYPFELVVVDTGSDDGSLELIEAEADIAGNFTWCDDFSKARNYCISLATNDWILTIDSDEYVENIDLAALETFISSNQTEVGRIERINQINSVDNTKEGAISKERIARLFNRNYYCYRGRIHEQIVPISVGAADDYMDIPYGNVAISALHDGYIGSEEDISNKAKRNIELLLLDLEEYGDDTYTLFQLGKSFFVLKNYESAFECFERALNMPLDTEHEYVQDLIETYGYTLLELGRFKDMLLLENVYEDLQHSADYIFVMGLAYMNNGLFDRAIEEFLKATSIKNAKVEGVNSFKAYYNAGVIAECLGRAEEAIGYYCQCGEYQPSKERLKALGQSLDNSEMGRSALQYTPLEREYLLDEVRDGFYISGRMKRCWASQLVILGEVDKLCKKYGITYYAEWGTLLGTVRHGGFIPWDDDMDICMKRDDYDRFKEVAHELPKPYAYHTCDGEYDYWDIMGKVANSTRINFDADFLKKHYGCPYALGIDVFPLDYIAPTSELEKEQYDLINYAMAIGDQAGNGDIKGRELELQLKYIEEGCKKIRKRITERGRKEKFDLAVQELFLSDKDIRRRLYHLADRLFAIYSSADSEYLGQVGLRSSGSNGAIFKKHLYAEPVLLPFENVDMPVPPGYEAILRDKYGDYMRQVKNGGGSTHDYPYFRHQETQVKEAGIKIPDYEFSKALYGLHNSEKSENSTADAAASSQMEEVLFVVARACDWPSVEYIYNIEQAKDNTSVKVMPVPYYFKNFLGEIEDAAYEIDKFDASLPIVSYKEYSLENVKIDRIYIQQPYDKYHDTMTVHPDYYSDALLKSAKELILAPYMLLEKIESNSPRAYEGMKYYVSMPGVLNADRIILPNEGIRESYINYLSEISGNDLCPYWKKTIEVLCKPTFSEMQNNQKGRKRIMLHISSAFYYENMEAATKKLDKVRKVFDDNSDAIEAVWVEENEIRNYVNQMGNFDAYYGSPGLLAHRMRIAGKPVMIINPEV